MFANSSPVVSNQTGPHERLETTVRRHLSQPWRAPLAEHDRQAFAQARQWLGDDARPLILDSGCGTGRSSVALARRFPQARVLGLDQSEHRLQRGERRFGEALPENLRLVRCDCAGFWRLAQDAGWRVQRHYLLYPNPWPKSAHLKRRWHGHPVFPHLLALGGELEARSNWRLYLEELAAALALAGITASVTPVADTEETLTDFEEKYRLSGHQLWRLSATLGGGPGAA
ncbi:tRNA (guanine(46)-N(7))-methyltransferase TrmB [Alloalcanivorax xenomutans]|uniref:tRNA (guanine(46)-N(7))-methyltransferase TrmB n=1 Tax=Alloalcanivorax xenomutans TaxID=1094342 RepID=UPI00292DCE5B|nr:methyltransferase domain-containing protein [Alloalcanivorax xenomutans]WOA33327.1 methyltransferase domain-containing protein [Alloalcanivorax xenomutans]